MAEEKVEQEGKEIVLEDPKEEVKEEPKEEPKEEVSVQQEETEPKEEVKGEDELETYSKSVQTRINKLTEKYRQEERDKQEALRVSQQLLEENKKLQSKVKALDTGYVSEYGTRLQAQTEQAKRMYKEAYEAGDPDKMVDAQQQLAAIAVEQQKYNTAKVRVEAQQQQPQQAQQQPQQAQQQPQPQPQPDARAKKWAADNEWFGDDTIMTNAAFTIHNQLVDEGFDTKTEEYYDALNGRMRKEFPHKFQTAKKTNGSQVASAGNSASRNKKTGRRTVKLTPSQIEIARKLNVPLEEYAKYVKE